ncbi:MAG: trimethylamine methyltransferase family protein, partial [Rhodobacteraceae bacterium]|nr:trimethylamine methyltransferase family protein [Paracoccaceae bacterium]
MAEDITGRKRRSGGRDGNARRSSGFHLDQMPWRIPRNPDRPTEPIGPEGVAAIHRGAMRILSEIGIVFLNDEALDLFRQAGCRVQDQTVRMDEDFVMEMVRRAPASFTITPRNPERQVTIGDGHMVFLNVSSPPNAWDIVRGKRSGDFATYREFIMLSQAFNCIHMLGGYPVEPVDIHPSVRHLDCLYEKLTLTDKVAHAYSLGRERVEDVMEMVRIAGGLTHAEFDASPRMFTNINSVSPLKHDFPMIDGALRMARRGQPVIVTPFTLAGAMAPVTMAGAVALSIAEGLAAIALLQYAAPGCPVGIGTFTSNVDMRSGAPAFGTPEYMRATQITGQLARFYGLPLRSSGVCTANIPDGQSMWETSNSLWAAVQSGTNMVYHAAGWLEGGLVSSYEKFMMDIDQLGMMQRLS